MSVAGAPVAALNYGIKYRHHFARFGIQCSDSKRRRGFGPQEDNAKKGTTKEQKGMILEQRKSTSRQSGSVPDRVPVLSSQLDKISDNKTSELQFEKRLEAVRRSANEKKKAEDEKEFGAIDYDAPVKQEENTIGLGTKIGIGVAVVGFGLVFAFGDILPSGSLNSSEDNKAATSKLSKEERAILESRLQQYEATLSSSPKDLVSLEGAAVTSAELGKFTEAASLLEDLAKEKPSDPEVFRLLGEVKYELKDYDASAAAYKSSAKMLNTIDFEVLRGLTNSLLAAKKPDEAVHILLEARGRLNMEQLNDRAVVTESSATENGLLKVDPFQVELLLGKAYSDWGHISDAVAVYDQLISDRPNDFRGFLAKGIILKENGNVGDAERMFIQARFFAPEKAKALVDRYARQ
ncbi:hypothetical protein Nepgr_005720 [Nepenthes gracilis]|uniref:Uncharacterized protein n=1 Tax=Nepenthes gracilis TaxID=150966 RepID=A0AAD3S3V0_NEPGR|nr:hypothetical protein Nepgr_005720 [Nepenthes gracilis]